MAPNPLYLTTAIEAVVRAGDLQMAQFGGDFQIDKKGTIDLVTEVDLEVEAMFRALVAERFPHHHVLAEELGGGAAVPAGPCWVFDPIDGTTNYAHGLPIFCASLALEIDGVAQVGAVFDPTRRELFTAQRGGGAFLNDRPLRVSSASALVDAMLVTGFPYDVHSRVDEIVGLFGRFVGTARAVRRLGSAAIDLCYVAAGRMDGFWERDLKPWDAVRVHRDTMRSMEAGDEGAEFIVVGAPNTGPGDADTVQGWWGYRPDPDQYLFTLLHSTGSYAKYAGYSNPKMDELIESERAARSEEERRRSFRQLSELMSEEAVYIAWHYGSDFKGLSPKVEGFVHFQDSIIRYQDISLA